MQAKGHIAESEFVEMGIPYLTLKFVTKNKEVDEDDDDDDDSKEEEEDEIDEDAPYFAYEESTLTFATHFKPVDCWETGHQRYISSKTGMLIPSLLSIGIRTFEETLVKINMSDTLFEIIKEVAAECSKSDNKCPANWHEDYEPRIMALFDNMEGVNFVSYEPCGYNRWGLSLTSLYSETPEDERKELVRRLEAFQAEKGVNDDFIADKREREDDDDEEEDRVEKKQRS